MVLKARKTKSSRPLTPKEKVFLAPLVPKNPPVAIVAAFAPEHAEISAGKLADGPVRSKVYTGHVDAINDWLVTYGIHWTYPLLGASGRDVLIECHGKFPLFTEFFIYATKPGKSTGTKLDTIMPITKDDQESFKVIIDTDKAPTGHNFKLILQNPDKGLRLERCTFDLVD